MLRSVNLTPARSHIGILFVLLLYFIVVLLTMWRLPLSIGPDEAAHFMLARFIENEGYLPVSAEDRTAAGFKSDQPPLNAMVIATAFFLDDLSQPPFVKLTADEPRRGLVVDGVVNESDRIFNVALNTEDPLAGEILFWHFGRLMSAIFSGFTLLIIYFIALKLFEDKPAKNLWALAAVLCVAFIPTYTFISSVFSYENLLGLWLALYLLIAIYLLKGYQAWWLFFLAGLLVGLAIVTKLSSLPAPLSLLVLIIMAGLKSGWKFRAYLARLVLSLLGLCLGAGWWFVFIEIKLNKVAELGWFRGLLAPLASDNVSSIVLDAAGSGSFDVVGKLAVPSVTAWAEDIFKSFWSFRQVHSNYVYIALFIIMLLILAKLVQISWQDSGARGWILFLLFYTGLFLILPLVRLLVTGFASVAGQGQHVLFPAAGAFAVLWVAGLAAWFPTSFKQKWLGGLVLGLALLGWNVAHIFTVYQVAIPLPVRTVPPGVPATATRLDLDLGPILLEGFELTGLTDDGVCCIATPPALGVYLYWRAQEFAPDDYLTSISLVDDQGKVQSLWLGHGANGRLPSRAWELDDLIRDEIYLPIIDLAPGTYTLNLAMRAAKSTLTDGQNSTFDLTQITLPRRVPPASDATGQPLSAEVWLAGEIIDQHVAVYERSTIQVITAPNLEVRLVGPDQVEHSPVERVGRISLFVVELLWPKGDYRVMITSPDQTNRQEVAVVSVRGLKRQTSIPNSQTRINANFANQLMLLGVNLPKRNLNMGERLPVILHWQALRLIPANLIMFTRVRDQTGTVWGGYDRWPREIYNPLLWAAEEVVEDGFTIELKPNTPPGLYYLDVGFYLPVGEAAVSLPLVQDGQLSDVSNVSLGPFKLGDALPAGVSRDLPQPELALNQPFGDAPHITLLGFDASSPNNSEPLSLTLYWRSEVPLSTDYTIFIHLLNSQGDIVAQQDQPPLNGAYPTSLWQPGEIVTDNITVPVPPNLPADTYCLMVGLYDLNTGLRLAVPGHEDNSLTLECY